MVASDGSQCFNGVSSVGTDGPGDSPGSLRRFVVPDSQSDLCSDEGVVPETPRQRQQSLDSIYRKVAEVSAAKRKAERHGTPRRVKFKLARGLDSESESDQDGDIGGGSPTKVSVSDGQESSDDSLPVQRVRRSHTSLQSVVCGHTDVLSRLVTDMASLGEELEGATATLVRAEQYLAMMKQSLGDDGQLMTCKDTETASVSGCSENGVGSSTRPYTIEDDEDSTTSE